MLLHSPDYLLLVAVPFLLAFIFTVVQTGIRLKKFRWWLYPPLLLITSVPPVIFLPSKITNVIEIKEDGNAIRSTAIGDCNYRTLDGKTLSIHKQPGKGSLIVNSTNKELILEDVVYISVAIQVREGHDYPTHTRAPLHILPHDNVPLKRNPDYMPNDELPQEKKTSSTYEESSVSTWLHFAEADSI